MALSLAAAESLVRGDGKSPARPKPRKPKDGMKGMTPYEKREWLETNECREIMDLADRDRKGRQLLKEFLDLLAALPSGAWAEVVDRYRGHFPPGGKDTRMVLSQVSGRLTPPYNLQDEDSLDDMTPTDAFFYNHPASPSAVAIRAIEATQATPVGGQW